LPLGLPFLKQPWNNVDNKDTYKVYVDEIFPDRNITKFYPETPILGNQRVIARRDNTWHAKYWLGELYPDSENITSSNTWSVNGNLETGPNKFYRASYETFPIFDRKRKSVLTSSKGSSSFINGSPSGQSDKHFWYANIKNIPSISLNSTLYSGDLTGLGVKMSLIFKSSLPSTIMTSHPFTLKYKYDKPTEWFRPAYTGQRTIVSIPKIPENSGGVPRIYYDSNYNFTGNGEDADVNPFYTSGVVRMTNDASTSYLVVSGLSAQNNFALNNLSTDVLFSVIRTFLDGGQYTANSKNKICQIPFVNFISPKNSNKYYKPAKPVIIQWNTRLKRWDGERYTEEYPPNYNETTPLIYNLKYSNNEGKTWYNVIDNSPARIGAKDVTENYFPGTTNFHYWDITNTNNFPQGYYILRIECYRQNIDLHYSYDQRKIEIVR